ncbi:carbamoyltransferase C-terminal domain-containing protein [Streptomyces sp. NPDC055078]
MGVHVGLYDDHNAGFAAVDESGVIGYTEFERITRVKNQEGWLPSLVGTCFDRLPLDRLESVTAPRPELVKDLLRERYGAVAKGPATVDLEGRPVRVLPQPDLHGYFHVLAATTLPLAGPGVYLTIVFDAEQPRFGWLDLRTPLESPAPAPLTPVSAERWFNGAVFGDLFGRIFYGNGDLSNCGKLMGLSAWGSARLRHVEQLERLARDSFDPDVETWNGYCLGSADNASAEAERLTGANPRNHELSTTLDLAASAQELFTHRFREQVAEGCARTLKDIRNAGITDEPIGILYGGGCALSVVSNREIREISGLPVFIPPFAHDASQFVGGAVWAGLKSGLRWPGGIGWPGVPEHTEDHVTVAGATAAGHTARPASPAAVAEIIASGGLLALARGGAEAGPRALGHRSLLARANDPRVRHRLNDEVKKREWYRPFAPMLPREEFVRYFGDGASPASHYMLDSYRVRPEARDRLSSVTGPDGVSRPQAIDASADPFLHEVCREMGRLTGDPVLLNTSLNAPGRTIAHDLTQVVADVGELGLDALVVDGHFLGTGGNA